MSELVDPMKRYSKYYMLQLRHLHKTAPEFGTRRHLSEDMEDCIARYSPKTFLDYGCGKGGLLKMLNRSIPNCCVGYDPAIEEYSDEPSGPSEMLISTDVLEHIEPNYIDAVLQHIDKHFSLVAYLLIATTPAKKTLPDGRNAHLIQEGPDWWRRKILENIDANIAYEKFDLDKFILVLEKETVE